MKKLVLITTIILVSYAVMAQVPRGFNYQAVARNTSGAPLASQDLAVRFSISGGSTLFWQEEHNVKTSPQGLFSIVVGGDNATRIAGSASTFDEIDWSQGNLTFEVSIKSGEEFISVGSSTFQSVPYALYSGNEPKMPDPQTLTLNGSSLSISDGNDVDLSVLQDGTEDADADPTNEIQDLGYLNGKIFLSGDPTADSINLAGIVNPDNIWSSNNDTIYTSSSVGIGTSQPNESLLAVQSSDPQVEKPLFEVRNDLGNPVFAVYNDGVMVFVDEDKQAKGFKGGFAVGGYNSATKGPTQEFLRITPDSVRIWVPEDIPTAKGSKGGFAVGGYNSQTKAPSNNLLEITSASTNIYFDTTAVAKGQKGGFAVGGYRKASKGTSDQLMSLTKRNYLIGKDAGTSITTGLNNTFFGWEAGLNNSTGNENIFIGRKSGYSNLGADENIFIGNESGLSTESGYGNVFVGNQAGYENLDGYYNSMFGYQAGYYNQHGNYNSAYGFQSGFFTESSYNTLLGFQAGANISTGENNIAIGYLAGLGIPTEGEGITGSDNVFIGSESGSSATTGSYNVMIGDQAGYSTTEGLSNVMIGDLSGTYNTTGSYNVMIGDNSGYSNTEGENNIFVGKDAGYSNELGYNNVMIGYEAGYFSVGNGDTWNGNFNVFLGHKAGYGNTSGAGNVFLGYFSGWSSDVGDYQTMIGHAAGLNSTGSWNTFVGAEAGADAGTGTNNTFVGIYAGEAAENYGNTSVGHAAGQNAVGDYNTSVGIEAGQYTSGAYNVSLGSSAGQYANGEYNTIVGAYAGRGVEGVSSNYNNTLVGTNSGASLLSGHSNTMLGLSSGYNTETGSGNVFLGAFAGFDETGSDKLYIANSSTADPLIYGDFALGAFKINGNGGVNYLGEDGYGWVVDIPASQTPIYYIYSFGDMYAEGTLYTASDIAYKKNIVEVEDPVNKLKSLRGVHFDYTGTKAVEQGAESKNIGVIAQEVEAVFPELVRENMDGQKAVNYTGLIPVLIEAIKDQQTQIEAQQAEIEELKRLMNNQP